MAISTAGGSIGTGRAPAGRRFHVGGPVRYPALTAESDALVRKVERAGGNCWRGCIAPLCSRAADYGYRLIRPIGGSLLHRTNMSTVICLT
jgi:hypothetical protein